MLDGNLGTEDHMICHGNQKKKIKVMGDELVPWYIGEDHPNWSNLALLLSLVLLWAYDKLATESNNNNTKRKSIEGQMYERYKINWD